MSTSLDGQIVLEAEPLSDLTQQATKIYEEKIKALVEPEQNGRGIAIHPESGGYIVAPPPT